MSLCVCVCVCVYFKVLLARQTCPHGQITTAHTPAHTHGSEFCFRESLPVYRQTDLLTHTDTHKHSRAYAQAHIQAHRLRVTNV